MNAATREITVKDKLLAAADTLFYADGVHTVGIDRIIATAGVAKASLYSAFGSKDALVEAYLQGRAERRKARITAWLERYETPRTKLLGIFDLLAEHAREPGFRGCAFINANAEGERVDAVNAVTLATRAWVRETLATQARALGVRDAKKLGAQLALLYDGAMINAAIEHDLGAVALARGVAETLVDAAPRRTTSAAKPK